MVVRRAFGVTRTAGPSLWRVGLDPGQRSSPVTIEGGVPFTEVASLAASRTAVWAGTDRGLLRVADGRARAFDLKVLTQNEAGTMFWHSDESLWEYGVRQVAVDADGFVWVGRPWWPASYAVDVFHSERDFPAGEALAITGPLLSPAAAPGVAASPLARGAWVFAGSNLARATRAAVPVLPDSAGQAAVRRSDALNVPACSSLAVLPSLREAQSLLGGRPPDLPLSRIHAAVDTEGRAWIAGEDEQGVRLFVAQGATLRPQTGFEKLLGGSRVNEIAVDRAGRVYLATDGAGVLLFDGQAWHSHAVNTYLPHLAGTRLTPATHVLPLADGRLCVSTGDRLIIR